MKNRNKWIGGGLAVIVLIAAIVLETNSELFKGQFAPAGSRLRRVERSDDQRQVGPVGSPRLVDAKWCIQMMGWLNEGTLTGRLGARTGSFARQCEDLYPEIWYGHGSVRHCELLRLWLAQGVLTDRLRGRGTIEEASTCSTTYPDLWNNFGSLERCELLEDLVEGGSPTSASPGYGYEEYLVCQERERLRDESS